MRIAFIHNQKAFLPELRAYHDFFSSRGIECAPINQSQVGSLFADVYWHFMGTSFKRGSGITIHEYVSASVPPFAGIKNAVKKKFNTKPDFRLFLNEWVFNQFQFRDDVPFGFRDMGVSTIRVNEIQQNEKPFDFIYIGELANRNIESILELFAHGSLRERNILILSRDYSRLQKKFHLHGNIHFKGPVEQSDVINYLLQSKFGLNLIPNREPFNEQTSTKLLEYAAAKLPIISNDYCWVRNFQQQFGARFYFIANDYSNLDWSSINQFAYLWPDLSTWDWETKIQKSGVLQFLQSKFPTLNLTSSAASGRILQ